MSEPAAIVLDIEGTTTPIDFVGKVLFPYARARIAEALRTRCAEPAFAEVIRAAAAQSGTDALDIEQAIALFLRWSDADQKVGPLKILQGLLWEQGYRDGTLHAPIYPDVVPALRAWGARGIQLHIYSSGSVHAQRLLFAHSSEGDLSAHFRGHFDTAIGPKTDPDSYRRIQAAIGVAASDVLFLSDNDREISAARAAGWQARQVYREGVTSPREQDAIGSFSALVF